MIFLFYLIRFVLRISLLYAFVSLLIGIALAFFGIKPKIGFKRFILKKRWSFLLLILIILMCHQAQNFFQEFTIWFPGHIERSSIIGTWKKRQNGLKLNKDGSVDFSGKLKGTEGGYDKSKKYQWALRGHTLYIEDEEGEGFAEYRIIIFNGQYRILYEHEEANLLLTDMGFSKKDK